MGAQDNSFNNKAIILEKKLRELYDLELISKDQLNNFLNMFFSSGIAPTELIEAEYLKQLAEGKRDA